MRRRGIGCMLVLAAVLLVHGAAGAADAPHAFTCATCHTLHVAPGTQLTGDAANANLCLSCHMPGGEANGKRLVSEDQAVPGAGGLHHRWDAAMPAWSTSNNSFGLRAAADLANESLRLRLGNFGDVVTCSVCHDQHSQLLTPWDPWATSTGRHFMRVQNDLNQLCEDCHYFRSAASSGTDVRSWDGSRKSHPVGKGITSPDVRDPDQFVGAAPLEPNYNPQTGLPRYHQNGTGDANLTNNAVLDSAGKVRCLSCHGMHYTDSDSSTVDAP